MQQTPIQAGVVGFSGYSGAELVEILRRHPAVEPVLLEHRAASADEAALDNGLPRRPFSADGVAGLDVVFLATAPEVSMASAGMILDAGARVVDLSGAFRLGTTENYRHWYKSDHAAPELLAEAVYALPEINREGIADARLVSNPGCYPTAASLAIHPLVAEGLVDRGAGVVCDAKSGVSGAGKKPSGKTHFCQVTENMSAYSVMFHRHVPEVLRNTTLEESELSFTAQLLPLHRGILETIYVRTAPPADHTALASAYAKHYGSEPFVRIYPPGRLPDLQAVQRTNFCDIGIVADPDTGRATIVAAIDNLVKGAAGQAVQNMNLMFGLEETQALL